MNRQIDICTSTYAHTFTLYSLLLLASQLFISLCKYCLSACFPFFYYFFCLFLLFSFLARAA
ncbi:hypothetical protein F4703DRAFT_1827661 [Phycomyces blakesleeanus]